VTLTPAQRRRISRHDAANFVGENERNGGKDVVSRSTADEEFRDRSVTLVGAFPARRPSNDLELVVVTVPDEQDLAAMLEDVAAAKRLAHCVVLSLHWGVHFIPRTIAEYQVIVATAAFNAGADLILGHHAHVPKAIGVYGGKVCFFSLSNFIMSSTAKTPKKAVEFENQYGVVLDPDYPHLAYGADAKRSLIAKAVLTQEGAKRVSFLPVLIDRELRPEVLRAGDPRFDDALRYMEWASKGYEHVFRVAGDEIVIEETAAGGL